MSSNGASNWDGIINAARRGVIPEQIARDLNTGKAKTKRVGRNWMACCPVHNDTDPSLSITETADGRILVHCKTGCPQDAVIKELIARGLWPSTASTSTGRQRQKPTRSDKTEVWEPIVPPPGDALPPTPAQLRCDILHEYRGPDDQLLYYIRRHEARGEERKQFHPLTYGRFNGKLAWHPRHPHSPRPLYGLNRLTHAAPEATIVILEGEKKANTAQRMFLDMVAISWSGGAHAVNQADWSPLFGQDHRILIWPDADKRKYPDKPAPCEIATADLLKFFPRARILDTTGLADRKDGYDADDFEHDTGADERDAWLSARIRQPKPEQAPSDALTCLELPAIAGFHQIPPRPWAYGKFLLFGSAAVLGAMDGTGKGFVTVAHILALVTGKPILGETVWRAGPVGIVTYEDDADEWLRRIAAACIHYEIDYNDIRPHVFFLHRPGGRVVLAQRMASGDTLYPDSPAIIAKLRERKAVGLIVDPFNSAHLMDDGNSNVQIVRVAMELTHIAQTANVAVLVLHHLRKGATGGVDDLMGAVSLRATFRSCRILQIMSPEEASPLDIPEAERFRYLRVSAGKENYAPRASKAIWFKLVSVDLGNPADIYTEGDSVAVAISWKPPSPFEGVSLEAIHEILDAVRKGPSEGERYSPKRQAKTWAGHLIVERADRTPDQAVDILASWISSGLLMQSEYRNKQENKVIGLTVNEALASGMARPVSKDDLDE
jgi:hypothetical protein